MLLRAFLESGPSLYLGKLSFTMYIYHNIAQYVLFDYVYSSQTDALRGVQHALATLALSVAFGLLFFNVEIAGGSAAKRFATFLLAT